jgi:Homeodomain-like domain
MCQLKLTFVDRLASLSRAVDSHDPGIGLAAVAALRTLVEELEALHVANARDQGWSWQAIAEQLGITRQSVHKKHRGNPRRSQGC